jgi:multidrug efflux pump
VLEQVPDIKLFMQPVQDLTVEDRVSRTQYQFSMEDADAKELSYWVPKFVERIKTIPVLRDVASDQQLSGLQTRLVIDRTSASRLGITPQMLDDALYDAFGQRQISTIYTDLNQYHVILENKPGMATGPEALNQVFLRSATGGSVPLSAITRIETSTAPLAVNHQGQFPVVTISFNLARGASIGDAVKEIERARDEMQIPPSIAAEFLGTAQAFRLSLVNTPFLILAALVTMYLLLGILYESYIHPVTILSTLPSAGVGALLSLMLFGIDFSVIALIGIILLIGIVKKNAILMIDFAIEAERKEGLAPPDAIYKACLLRFRPILMTTMAALLGAVPLALGNGVGSELRRPLGISIIGGLIFSQVLTLYTTPVIYLAFGRVAKRLFPGLTKAPVDFEPAENL